MQTGRVTGLQAQSLASMKAQTRKTHETLIRRKVRLSYLLHLPAGYEENRNQRWPLLLFLHGAGERGANLNRVAVHGPPRLVKSNPEFEFILVSPQCPAGETWEDDSLLALLEDIVRQYRVDESRLYLTGLSMGGYGTWSLGLKHPRRFAAIAPVCGGGSILPILIPASGNTAALRKLPIWAFHGAQDDVVPLQETERMITELRKIGNSPRITIYPHAGHDSWTETYANPELYKWFLQHRRSSSRVAASQKVRPRAAKD